MSPRNKVICIINTFYRCLNKHLSVYFRNHLPLPYRNQESSIMTFLACSPDFHYLLFFTTWPIRITPHFQLYALSLLSLNFEQCRYFNSIKMRETDFEMRDCKLSPNLYWNGSSMVHCLEQTENLARSFWIFREAFWWLKIVFSY